MSSTICLSNIQCGIIISEVVSFGHATQELWKLGAGSADLSTGGGAVTIDVLFACSKVAFAARQRRHRKWR